MWDQSSKLCSRQGLPSPHPQNPSELTGPTQKVSKETGLPSPGA